MWRIAAEEKLTMEEGLRRIQGSMDRLKEEKEAMHQEKAKIKRMAKTEIERLEEELRHKKERNDRLRAQTNRLLKDKQANFEKLY